MSEQRDVFEAEWDNAPKLATSVNKDVAWGWFLCGAKNEGEEILRLIKKGV
jgi:hypothetical protein